MEHWEAIARESIRDLVARYNANGDSGRFPQMMELFAPGAEMVVGERSYSGHEEILGLFTGTRQRVRGGEAPAWIRHFTATHQIDLEGRDAASGRAYFAVLSHVGLDHWGRYLDRYRAVEGHWRFAHRRVLVDAYAPGSLFADGGSA